jgi:hypothetical protein
MFERLRGERGAKTVQRARFVMQEAQRHGPCFLPRQIRKSPRRGQMPAGFRFSAGARLLNRLRAGVVIR